MHILVVPVAPECHHCTWDSWRISVCGANAKYIEVIAGNLAATLTALLTIFLRR